MSTDDVTSNPEAPAEPESGADTGNEMVNENTADLEGPAETADAEAHTDDITAAQNETPTVDIDRADEAVAAVPDAASSSEEDADNARESADQAEEIFGEGDSEDSDEVDALFAVAFEHIRDEPGHEDEPEAADENASPLAPAEASWSAGASEEVTPEAADEPTPSPAAAAIPAEVNEEESVAEAVPDAEFSENTAATISPVAAEVSNTPTLTDGAVPPLASASPLGTPPVTAEFQTETPGASTVEERAPAAWANPTSPATALTWVNPAAVSASTPTAAFSAAATEVAADDVLAQSRLRPAFLRSGVLVPLGTLVVLAAAYAGTMVLWPLNAVAPTIEEAAVETAPAAPATPVWPTEGAAAIGVEGMSSLASTEEELPIASISKVVSSLMVLDEMPLQPGEQGPEYGFTYGDNLDYWTYRSQDQSALDVPVDGVLTEYQLLQGTLIGSANNYIDHLADDIWATDSEFADAAEEWLNARGLGAITIRTPSGFDDRNVSTPGALLSLSEKALQNPVVAEIVATQAVELPGAGLVVNTNGMLADPGVVGVKTGTLEEDWNLLTAKEITIDDTTVRVHVAALGQVDDEKRLELTRSLIADVETALTTQATTVPAGTVVGTVTTLWGESVDIVTESDADVVLWNAATANTAIEFDLGETREPNGTVGTLSVTGPIDDTSVATVLESEVEGPSVWWRLTHPLDLLGLNK